MTRPAVPKWLLPILFLALVAGLAVLSRQAGDGGALLARHHAALRAWVEAHYALAVLAFIAAYFVGVTFSLPGAVWMTITGGLLFGTLATVVYAVGAATAGATAVFLLARHVFRDPWSRRAGPALRRMENGFREHAFSYLLVLRLVPVFPFWLVNLVPAFLGVSLRTYVGATFLGIIPGSVVYAGVGCGLESLLAAGGVPDLGLLWSPQIVAPLLGLAGLSLLPVLLARWRRRLPPDASPDGGDG